MVRAVCNVTLYPDSCYESLMSSSTDTGRPDDLFEQSMLVSLNEINKTSYDVGGMSWVRLNDSIIKSAFRNCLSLLDLALDKVKDSMALPSDLSNISTANDLNTWLSAAGT